MKYSDAKKELLKDNAINYFYKRIINYESDTTKTFTNYFSYY